MNMERTIMFNVNGAIVQFGKELTDEWLEEWPEVYYGIGTMKEHAENLADKYFEGCFENDVLLEGYGTCRRLNRSFWLVEIWDADANLVSYALVTETF